MPEDVLNRIRSEIDERLAELRPAVEEIPRLEAALAALRDQGSRSREATPKRRAPSGPTGVRSNRAPRGANRQSLVDAVSRRPGASAAELAKVTDIKLATVRTTLSTLVKTGEMTRDDVGGVTGYHPATE